MLANFWSVQNVCNTWLAIIMAQSWGETSLTRDLCGVLQLSQEHIGKLQAKSCAGWVAPNYCNRCLSLQIGRLWELGESVQNHQSQAPDQLMSFILTMWTSGVVLTRTSLILDWTPSDGEISVMQKAIKHALSIIWSPQPVIYKPLFCS